MFWSAMTLGTRKKNDGSLLADLRAQFAAIDRAQAIIEFSLDGTILHANENFCEAMGYALDEIQGRHHRMFAEPAYAASTEYRAFWEKLGRGEYHAGQYKRLAKGGREIWIQATYNPIFDASGKAYKVVKFATDITAERLKTANYEGQLDAIGKAQAVIEFCLDGTILTANDNFCKAMGYALSEIQGRHHRMFAEPGYAASAEYRAFWEKLGRGEFHAGQYKRLAKGGREIWIQATYNPILDMNGKPFKVVKYATDVTEQVRAAAAMREAVEQTRAVANAAQVGDLTQRVPMTGKTDELEMLCAGVNSIVESMADMVGSIKESAHAVGTAATEIANGHADLSDRTEKQASSLEETASTMEQLTGTVKQNAENARQANQLALGASDIAVKGGQVAGEVVTTMSGISEASRKIADIISTIDGIAFQTNILALNAAVEAARAGEQGRGFAVVASEVRNLAQRSANAAKEIKQLIEDSVNRVEAGSRLVEQAGRTMEEIVSSVKRVTGIMADIAAASQEQRSGIEQVNLMIAQMDEVTQQNAALVEQAAATAQSMQERTQALMAFASRYTVTRSTLRSGGSERRGPHVAANPSRASGTGAARAVAQAHA